MTTYKSLAAAIGVTADHLKQDINATSQHFLHPQRRKTVTAAAQKDCVNHSSLWNLDTDVEIPLFFYHWVEASAPILLYLSYLLVYISNLTSSLRHISVSN